MTQCGMLILYEILIVFSTLDKFIEYWTRDLWVIFLSDLFDRRLMFLWFISSGPIHTGH
jgi:hypothetical protein